MTTTFQPGQHPDADHLNAFVEHALPLHEQQATLAHIAACADCRAIVYLAQSSIPEPSIQPHPLPARTPFFARWMLAFPAAAALACLVLLTIHIHNAAIARDQSTAASTAHLDEAPPPPPALPEPAATPKASPAPVLARTNQPPTRPTPAPHDQGAANQSAAANIPSGTLDRTLTGAATTNFLQPKMAATANAPADKQQFHGNLSGASYVPAAPLLPAPPSAAPLTATASPQPSLAGGGGGAAPRRELRSAATQYDLPRAQSQQLSPSPSPNAVAPNSGIYGGTGQANLNQNYIAGIPSSTAAAQTAAAASDTVNVSVDAVTAEAATLPAQPRPTLPSHLPALSLISAPKLQLAVDTAGSLFRSEDAGVTWHPVPAQWTGRAIKVALLPSSNTVLLGRAMGALSSPPTAAAKAAATPQAPTFQLTTDTGALWVSSDGQTWKQK